MGKPRSYLPANAVGAVENSHSANNHGGRMAKLERYAAISLAPAAADRADPRSGIPRPNDVDGTDPASLPRRPFWTIDARLHTRSTAAARRVLTGVRCTNQGARRVGSLSLIFSFGVAFAFWRPEGIVDRHACHYLLRVQ